VPQIVLLRHGQASFGGADYDVLSDTGHRQVALAKAALDERNIAPTVVVSGELRRQLGTAAAWTDTPVVDPRWNEYVSNDVLHAHGFPDTSLDESVGTDSRRFQDVLDVALTAWIAAGAAGPAVEPWSAFVGRVGGAFHELVGSLGPGETALVATSGGAIAAVAVAVLRLPHEHFLAFNRVTVNAAFTKIAIGRSGTSLVSFNEHAHLDQANLVTYR